MDITESMLDYYMSIAVGASNNSSDSETQVGCVSINPNEYSSKLPSANTFIFGASNLPTTRPEKYKYILHAEVNMVCAAAKAGVNLDGRWSVQTLSPCDNCMRTLFQAGVRTIIFRDEYRDFKSHMQSLDLDVKLSHIGKYTRVDVSAKGEL